MIRRKSAGLYVLPMRCQHAPIVLLPEMALEEPEDAGPIRLGLDGVRLSVTGTRHDVQLLRLAGRRHQPLALPPADEIVIPRGDEQQRARRDPPHRADWMRQPRSRAECGACEDRARPEPRHRVTGMAHPV